MNNNYSNEWFKKNHGKQFHPLEIIAILGQIHDYPVKEYAHLEERGHIIPASYRNGRITSVKLNFPSKTYLSDIEICRSL